MKNKFNKFANKQLDECKHCGSTTHPSVQCFTKYPHLEAKYRANKKRWSNKYPRAKASDILALHAVVGETSESENDEPPVGLDSTNTE